MADDTQASESIPAFDPVSAPVPEITASGAVVAPAKPEPAIAAPTPTVDAPVPAAKTPEPTVKVAEAVAEVKAVPATPPLKAMPTGKKAARFKAPKAEVKPAAKPAAAPYVSKLAKKSLAAPAKTPVAAKTPPAPVPVKRLVQATPKVKAQPKSTPGVAAPIARAKPAFPIVAKPVAVPKPSFFKETFAMTTPTFDFSAAFKTAFSEAQDKAKAAYEKSTVAMGDASEFAKGNVEALVESSKILASGLQELTTELVAESREAFETLTAEVKTIAGVKSPADFFKLQSELMRKQMDTLMANGTKHSEAFIKLATDAVAPISGRVSLAVEKVKAAA
ncbi:MAG: phasin family protein [Pseudomonadota bacterium]|nr:phasin family protein [Pseudomonadota bacterium]